VIGSSDPFQIVYFGGDPISIVSYTTDRSSISFVVLEKSPNELSTSTTSPIHKSQRPSLSKDHQSAIKYTSQEDDISMQEQGGNEVHTEEVPTLNQAPGVNDCIQDGYNLLYCYLFSQRKKMQQTALK
jgi:hypothetical protein